MKGEGTCSKIPEHAFEYPNHCVHPRPRAGDLICCFCGDLFIAEDAPGPHGQYKPRRRHVPDQTNASGTVDLVRIGRRA